MTSRKPKAKAKAKAKAKLYDASHHDRVMHGMATIFWGSAWADHVEEHHCCNLSGAKIEEVMPPIPAEAYAWAERVLGRIEQGNPMRGHNWPSMLDAARRADAGWKDGRLPLGVVQHENIDGYCQENAEHFGNCLAWMSMGAGVSWFDNHAEFPLEVPYADENDLQFLADDRCKLSRKPLKREE